jgi:hypothetical protein
MSYHTDDLPLASDFQPLEGEANFGPPILREVVGGAHIAPHCITIQREEFVLIDWIEGLPRHDRPGARAIRFPHGLIKFGESFEACARRLVANQMGMEVVKTRVVHVYSYLDETNHWHMEPIVITRVDGEPIPPDKAHIVRCPVGPSLPTGSAWRGKPPFEETFTQYIAQVWRLI